MFNKEKKHAPEKPIVREEDMRISAETVRFVVERCEKNGHNAESVLGQIILGAFQTSPPNQALDRAVELMQRAQDKLNQGSHK